MVFLLIVLGQGQQSLAVFPASTLQQQQQLGISVAVKPPPPSHYYYLLGILYTPLAYCPAELKTIMRTQISGYVTPECFHELDSNANS